MVNSHFNYGFLPLRYVCNRSELPTLSVYNRYLTATHWKCHYNLDKNTSCQHVLMKPILNKQRNACKYGVPIQMIFIQDVSSIVQYDRSKSVSLAIHRRKLTIQLSAFKTMFHLDSQLYFSCTYQFIFTETVLHTGVISLCNVAIHDALWEIWLQWTSKPHYRVALNYVKTEHTRHFSYPNLTGIFANSKFQGTVRCIFIWMPPAFRISILYVCSHHCVCGFPSTC